MVQLGTSGSIAYNVMQVYLVATLKAQIL